MPAFHRLTGFSLALVAMLLAQAAPTVQAQLNAQEQQIANLLAGASGQQRVFVEIDPILSEVARARAVDLAKRRYFSHVNPDGYGPNYLVTKAGYQLPSSYDQTPSGNNIESLAAGDSTPKTTWDGWMDSPPHKRHLLGLDPYFAQQTSLGVGYYYDEDSEYRHYWVVITAPPASPGLSISTPGAGARLATSQVTIAGTTSGAPAATRIVHRIENASGEGEFRDAAGTTLWSTLATGLAPGINTIRVRSLSASGSTIRELTRTVRYVVLTPLLVSVEGAGSVSGNFLGPTQRELGLDYTITALPAPGWLFASWAGAASSGPSVSFTMEEGLTLTARFRLNPFYSLRGSYSGLVQTQPPSNATSGLLKISITATGAFSGRLLFAGKAYPVNGKFELQGAAQVTVSRGALSPLVLALQLDLSGATEQITGSVSDGTFTAGIEAEQSLPAGTRHFAAGRYTVVLPADPANAGAEYPQGDGYALLAVSANGAARLAGALADGRIFTCTASVSKNGLLPIYLPANAGSLAGKATVNEVTGAVEGSVLWSKTARASSRYYPAGFTVASAVMGGRYAPPPSGTPALQVSLTSENSSLQLSEGDLGEAIEQPATLSPENRVTIPSPALPRLALRVNASTGRYSGSFTHPVTGATSRIGGVILQNRNRGFGFFLGAAESGAATFGPAAP